MLGSQLRDKGISELANTLVAIFLASISLCYLLLTNYLDIGSFQETILVTIVIGFLLGAIAHEMKFLLFAVLLSIVIAFIICSCLIAYFVLLPFIELGEISYWHMWTIAATSIIDKIFVIVFFFIFIFILFSGILGVFLS